MSSLEQDLDCIRAKILQIEEIWDEEEKGDSREEKYTRPSLKQMQINWNTAFKVSCLIWKKNLQVSNLLNILKLIKIHAKHALKNSTVKLLRRVKKTSIYLIPSFPPNPSIYYGPDNDVTTLY